MKNPKSSEPTHEVTSSHEACEIIELMIDQVDLMTRAFSLISEACEAGQSQKLIRCTLDDLPTRIH